jgi:hypothetical protein
LAGEGGAEADGGDADGDPAELIRYADKARNSDLAMITRRGVPIEVRKGRTYFCSHDHNWPAPIKLDPKHRPATKPVANTATQGTFLRFSLEKTCGAWPSDPSVKSRRAPAKRAWFPADKTLVRMTAFMTLPAAWAPVIWKTMVKGEVTVLPLSRPVYV